MPTIIGWTLSINVFLAIFISICALLVAESLVYLYVSKRLNKSIDSLKSCYKSQITELENKITEKDILILQSGLLSIDEVIRTLVIIFYKLPAKSYFLEQLRIVGGDNLGKDNQEIFLSKASDILSDVIGEEIHIKAKADSE